MNVFKLGLTGSIGMGKSATARIFAEEGCHVWDADAAVHRLYSIGGSAVDPIAAAFPDVLESNQISREMLKTVITKDPSALKRIEDIVHPLVALDRQTFIKNQQEGILVFDIPLLFETNGNRAMDAVACVNISSDEQERRVMERGTMTKSEFHRIKDKQMPNAEKVALSDYVIVTDTLEHARAQVQDILVQIRGRMNA